MKLVVVFFWIGLLSVQAEVYSQVYTVSMKNASLRDVIRNIENQSDYRFFFSDEVTDLNQRTQVDANGTIDQLLHTILSPYGLGYKMMENNLIIISPYESTEGLQQGAPITGTITDTDGEPVIGASIAVKGTGVGTVSDINGKFSIQAGPSATLVVSFVGYKTQEIAVKNQTNISIILAINENLLEETVVIGYGVQKKASLTGSVASVKGEQLQNVPTSNLTNALAGKLGGVTISQSAGGRPGNSSDITIRARGTWNSTAPLYVIDGVVRDSRAFDALDASSVESISVLKDASAASIYGSRAANGVILVQTKKGQSGQALVSYSGSVGFSDFTVLPKMESAMGHIAFTNDYEREFNVNPNSADIPLNDKWGVRYWPTIYKNGKDASGGYISGSVFADDEIEYYKTHDYNLLDEAWMTPITTNHAINISGGTDKVTYYAGATYYNESGAFKALDYTKYSMRGNLEAKIAKGLTAVLSINTDNSVDKGPNGFGGITGISSGSGDRTLRGLFNNFIKNTHMIPGKVDGKYIGRGSNMTDASPVAIADGAAGTVNDRYWNTEYTASLKYELPWVKGLNVSALYNKYTRQNYYKAYSKPYDVYQLRKEGTNQHIVTNEIISSRTVNGMPSLSETHSTADYYQLNGFINYNNTFGKHEVSAMLGFEQAESEAEWFSASKSNYDLNDLPYFNFGPTDKQYYNIDGKGWEDARLSYIGRFNYAFDSRYLLEFSFRRDASVKFAKQHRWGFFPSGSAAWRISEESFFKESIPAINNLKLRGSVGLTGNDAVGSWQYMDLVNVATGGAYYGGSSAAYGSNIGTVANPLITWEKSLNYNGGLDAGILNNLFTVGFDYFFRHTYDILGSQTNEIPDTFGAKLADSNYGIVDSWGYELEVAFNKQLTKDLAVYARGNFGFSDNKIVEWAESGVPAHLSKIGKNWDRLAGYVSEDIVHTMTKNSDGTYTINGKYIVPATGYYSQKGSNYDITANNKYAMRPGSAFYKDIGSSTGVDADGNKIYSTTPDGIITGDDADKTWIVDRYNPPYNFGLLLGGNWKGFSLELFFQGLAGHQGFIASADAAAYSWNDSNWAYWSDDHFSYESNPNAQMPAPTNMGQLNMNNLDIYKNTNNTSFWVRDASFVRLKNITLSYDINKKLLSKAGISLAKVYVTGNNVALLYNPLKYYDPELSAPLNNPDPSDAVVKPATGINAYPLMRSFTVGVNFSF